MGDCGVQYMSGMSRIGDIAIGVCYAHDTPITVTGIISTGSGDTNCNSRKVARIGDVVVFNCGHTGIIVTGSPTVTANQLRVARIGDHVVGPMTAVIVSGSADSIVA